ncbi:uncharacterized protein MCYG_03508 [Microsporum canis CBS 113480]|uniref:Uncharacterized protein n=1 Tax=Arthroderma otae (strain ATCC MYA-4605 / CBS 113480) TaxID=554155 RepID=C5FLW7_ARTOC|nr:uncharacterized protein MCYG_03508 [Microsporum canis CBS 113480]EEQ30689.1 predicted protein [Microsporum canis CBS 113480]
MTHRILGFRSHDLLGSSGCEAHKKPLDRHAALLERSLKHKDNYPPLRQQMRPRIFGAVGILFSPLLDGYPVQGRGGTPCSRSNRSSYDTWNLLSCGLGLVKKLPESWMPDDAGYPANRLRSLYLRMIRESLQLRNLLDGISTSQHYSVYAC